MDQILDFAQGPLFRLTFAIMILGLLRIFILSVLNGFEAKKKAHDKNIPKPYVRKLTFGFLFPVRAMRVKPLYSIISIIFHIGLIVTPLFLFDHALLFENSIGISWIGITLPKEAADWLTLATIVFGALLLIYRASYMPSRFISRTQDFLWPLLLIVPFITGYVCSNMATGPETYDALLLAHILSGELIFVLLPFTKIAHCVLMPISQWITARSWKFEPDGPEKVRIALGKENEKL